MYSDALMDHFLNPRNIGRIDEPDAVGTIGDPDCGDYVMVFIKVKKDRLSKVSFLCQGCPAAIATGSMMTELASGRSLEEAVRITDDDIVEALCGLPEAKLHCSNLGLGALRQAILRYRIEEEEGPCIADEPVLERLQKKFRSLTGLIASPDDPLLVQARALSPEEAIGNPEEDDYPILKGRERMMEGVYQQSRGHAFTDMAGHWKGTLGEVAKMSLSNNYRRAIFVAALNALTRHAGIAHGSVHCKDKGPQYCALEAAHKIFAERPKAAVTLIGFQPRLAEVVGMRKGSKIVDLDPANLGKKIGQAEVVGADRTEESIAAADFVLVTGTTLVNGSLDRFLGLPKPTIFYGVTIAGAAALMGLPRFCPFGT